MPSEQMNLSIILTVFEEQLTQNGYRTTRKPPVSTPGDYVLVAEDAYNVILVSGFDTWGRLTIEWPEAQSALVELLSSRLSKSAPKAWDGYLVLICETSAPDAAEIVKIERDTTRVRKIVGTSDTLRTTKDVANLLDPFLPLPMDSGEAAFDDILDALPKIMENDVSPDAVRAVIKAFKELEPPLERLHQLSGHL